MVSAGILLDRAGWEIINFSLEYAAVAWVRLPKLFPVVLVVNLMTHPLFVFLLSRFGRGHGLMAICEIVIVLAEWAALAVFYRQTSRVGLLGLSLLMNAASFGTGLLLLI